MTAPSQIPPAYPRHSPSGETDAIASPWPYLALVFRWKYLTIGMPLLIAALVGAGLLLTPRQYVARGSFVPQEAGPSRGSLGTIAAQLGMGQLSALVGSQTSSSPQFYAALMRSQEVLLAVADATYETPTPQAFKGTLRDYFDIQDSDSDRARLRAIRRLNEKALAVDVDRNTGIVHFTVTLKNRALAGQVAAKFLEVVNDFNLKRRQGQVGREREFVERRANEALQELREAEATLASFHRRNRQFTESPDLQAVEGGLRRRVDLAQQLYVTLAQQFEMAKIEAVRNTPVITTIDEPRNVVAAVPRGTVMKTLTALVLSTLLGLGLALATERFRLARSTDNTGYEEFRRVRDLALRRNRATIE